MTGRRDGGGPGRPRAAAIDKAVLDAALDVLAAAGWGGFTMEAVIAGSGVSRAAVYRRFASRDELLEAAVASMVEELPRPDLSVPIRERLVRELDRIRTKQWVTRNGCIVKRAIAEIDEYPELAKAVLDKVIAPKRRRLREMVREAIEAGELRDDIDIEAMLTLLVGPMVYLGMMSDLRGPNAPTSVYVDALLRGFAPDQ